MSHKHSLWIFQRRLPSHHWRVCGWSHCNTNNSWWLEVNDWWLPEEVELPTLHGCHRWGACSSEMPHKVLLKCFFLFVLLATVDSDTFFFVWRNWMYLMMVVFRVTNLWVFDPFIQTLRPAGPRIVRIARNVRVVGYVFRFGSSVSQFVSCVSQGRYVKNRMSYE